MKKEKKSKDVEKVAIAPKLPKKKYVLVTDVSIQGEIAKKGDTIWLTEAGRTYFKSLNYIK